MDVNVELTRYSPIRGLRGSAKLHDGTLVRVQILDRDWQMVFPEQTGADADHPVAKLAAWFAATEQADRILLDKGSDGLAYRRADENVLRRALAAHGQADA